MSRVSKAENQESRKHFVLIPGVHCAFITSWTFTLLPHVNPYRTIGQAVLPIFQTRKLRPEEIGVICTESHNKEVVEQGSE